MEHVKKSWLDLFNGALLLLDTIFVAVYYYFHAVSFNPGVQQRWGIDKTTLIVVGIHVVCTLVFYPLLSRRLLWLSNIVTFAVFAMVVSTIIDSSGNTNIVYRLGYALLVFFMALDGIFAPLAAIILTWVVLLFTLTGGVSGTHASLPFNILIDSIVTISGVAGWLFFKRFYIAAKSKETIVLSDLLQQEQFKSV